jgi:hypothetical protein
MLRSHGSSSFVESVTSKAPLRQCPRPFEPPPSPTPRSASATLRSTPWATTAHAEEARPARVGPRRSISLSRSPSPTDPHGIRLSPSWAQEWIRNRFGEHRHVDLDVDVVVDGDVD